jgi:hypothetical protein
MSIRRFLVTGLDPALACNLAWWGGFRFTPARRRTGSPCQGRARHGQRVALEALSKPRGVPSVDDVLARCLQTSGRARRYPWDGMPAPGCDGSVRVRPFPRRHGGDVRGRLCSTATRAGCLHPQWTFRTRPRPSDSPKASSARGLAGSHGPVRIGRPRHPRSGGRDGFQRARTAPTPWRKSANLQGAGGEPAERGSWWRRAPTRARRSPPRIRRRSPPAGGRRGAAVSAAPTPSRAARSRSARRAARRASARRTIPFAEGTPGAARPDDPENRTLVTCDRRARIRRRSTAPGVRRTLFEGRSASRGSPRPGALAAGSWLPRIGRQQRDPRGAGLARFRRGPTSRLAELRWKVGSVAGTVLTLQDARPDAPSGRARTEQCANRSGEPTSAISEAGAGWHDPPWWRSGDPRESHDRLERSSRDGPRQGRFARARRSTWMDAPGSGSVPRAGIALGTVNSILYRRRRPPRSRRRASRIRMRPGKPLLPWTFAGTPRGLIHPQEPARRKPDSRTPGLARGRSSGSACGAASTTFF